MPADTEKKFDEKSNTNHVSQSHEASKKTASCKDAKSDSFSKYIPQVSFVRFTSCLYEKVQKGISNISLSESDQMEERDFLSTELVIQLRELFNRKAIGKKKGQHFEQ